MISFEKTLREAKAGDEQALMDIINQYRPKICKLSLINDVFDEDLYQTLIQTTIICIRKFNY